MNYQVSARKYRPKDFDEVLDQSHVVKALVNSIENGKVPHSLLFSGPRGVGKTSTARLFAKALNCIHSPHICNECDACLEIQSGNAIDIWEIDGASNRGIEQIREIKDNLQFAPLHLKYKIYIIDEIHMLTKEASNALLKTLEEPPERVIFILATTEPHKVLPTIRSRCQHYLFKRISSATIVFQLENIANENNIQFKKEALYLIAEKADGSMRDAQSIFDQMVLYTSGDITHEAVVEMLGIPKRSYFYDLMNFFYEQDMISGLKVLKTYLEKESDILLFVQYFINFLKEGIILKEIGYDSTLLNFSKETASKYQEVFKFFKLEEIKRILYMAIDLYTNLKKNGEEEFYLEASILKMFDYKNIIPLSTIYEDWKKEQVQESKREKTQIPKLVTKAAIKPSAKLFEAEEKEEISIENKNLTSKKETKEVNPTVKQNNLLEKEVINAFYDLSRIQKSKNWIGDILLIENTLKVEVLELSAFDFLNSSKKSLEMELAQKKINVKILFHFKKQEEKKSLILNEEEKESKKQEIKKVNPQTHEKKEMMLENDINDIKVDRESKEKPSDLMDGIMELFK